MVQDADDGVRPDGQERLKVRAEAGKGFTDQPSLKLPE